MAEINDLSSISSLSSADQIPIWVTAEGVTQKISVNQLVEYITEQINLSEGFVSQYAAPSATDFSVSISDIGRNVHLILSPVDNYANGTFVFPPVANCFDGQTILISTSKTISTATFNGNGADVSTAPASMAANAYVRMKFDAVFSKWIRIGG